MTTTSNLISLLKDVDTYSPDDRYWIEESIKRLEQQEQAINQLKTDLEFQGNKVAELTRDSIAFHDFFYKHDPMGYQAFYARNIS